MGAETGISMDLALLLQLLDRDSEAENSMALFLYSITEPRKSTYVKKQKKEVHSKNTVLIRK